MDYLEVQRFAKRHTCKCGNELGYRIFPDGTARAYCPGNPDHKEFIRKRSLTERWREGDPVPLEVANNLQKKYGGDAMTNKAALVAQKPEELVPDLQRMWPELLQKRNIALTMAQIAFLHDLSPFLQEIMLYKGNIVIAHKAKMRKALDTNKFKGYSTREATAADFKKRAWKKEDTLVVTLKEYEQAQKAEEAAAKRKGEAPEDRPTFLWILKEPADLAEKRAIDDALREAFADSIVLRLPSIEQAIVEGEYKEVTPETKPEEPTSAPPSEEKEHEGATPPKIAEENSVGGGEGGDLWQWSD